MPFFVEIGGRGEGSLAVTVYDRRGGRGLVERGNMGRGGCEVLLSGFQLAAPQHHSSMDRVVGRGLGYKIRECRGGLGG
jgi:hypothetical protein